MREHKQFFGIPLTEKDCLGWVLQNPPFEIIVNRTRGEVRVVMADWLKEREALAHLACLFVALADKAERMAAVKRPFYGADQMLDGGSGHSPRSGRFHDETRQYHANQAKVGVELDKLFDQLPAILEDCCTNERNFEAYFLVKHFFDTAAEYWPSEFQSKQKTINKLLGKNEFAPCRDFAITAAKEVYQYLEAVTMEFFKLKFSHKHQFLSTPV